MVFLTRNCKGRFQPIGLYPVDLGVAFGEGKRNVVVVQWWQVDLRGVEI